ncbi:exopolysaccharide Pel transporter PelG [Pseudogemmobacter sp. W21_MBD1_M6]|uniref:exopolysaccharide Pel transporter PelG n=1 Tax=Pseudogemmobacter sp. W21_MBD1_M6 TaxID=3240271 RepID=UPI003F971898
MTLRDTDTTGQNGIGWWLHGALLGPIRRFGAAIIITAGPWLVTVVALAIISISMQPVLGNAAIEDLRLTVVYAFCTAPLAAGPIGAIASRLVRRSVEDGDGTLVSEVFLVAAIGSGLITQALAVLICMSLGIEPIGIAVSFVFLSISAAMLWTSFAVLIGLRAFRFLISAFSIGMAISVICILAAATQQPTTEFLIWCFTAGVTVCVTLCIAHVNRLHGGARGNLRPAATALFDETMRHRHLCLGILLALCSVWVDKWVFWFGADGDTSSAGFRHFSAYDSVMFIAHLSIIPSFAAMLLFHDGEITEAIEDFRRALRDRSTYTTLRQSVDRLGQTVWQGVFKIVFVQAAVAAGLVLMAPLLTRMMTFSFAQFLMLQVGVIAVFLHSIVYLSSAVLILCSRNRTFFYVQFLFFGANLVASVVLYEWLGVSAYAIFLAALISAAFAFIWAYRALSHYDFLIFVGENDSLYSTETELRYFVLPPWVERRVEKLGKIMAKRRT